jgi:hypothetical protein
MELAAFIADLEARAAALPSQFPEADRFDFCANCQKPLPRDRTEFHRVHCEDYCDVCYEMRSVVAGRTHFNNAQREYEEEQKRLKLLRPGSDYLGGKG